MRTLIVVEKTSSAALNPEEPSFSFYVSNRLPAPAREFALHIRGHWGGCEIRNHWVRDALWAEDRTRSKNWNLNANLAVLRAGLIALKTQCVPHLSWPALFELSSFNPSIPFRLLTQHRFK